MLARGELITSVEPASAIDKHILYYRFDVHDATVANMCTGVLHDVRVNGVDYLTYTVAWTCEPQQVCGRIACENIHTWLEYLVVFMLLMMAVLCCATVVCHTFC